MPYRVAARPPRAGQWVLAGPEFSSIDEAYQYLELLRVPVTRLVRTHAAGPAVVPEPPVVRRPGPAASASPGLHPGLDRRRLAYVRYLLATNRIGEW